jgi:TM2 domain-containing membrane protein YozV
MSARSDLARLLRMKRFLSMRLAGRWLVDLIPFGKGPVERIGSACVLSAVFFFAVMAAAMLSGTPPAWGVTVAVGAFVAAATTLLVFVLGKPDDEVREEVDDLAEPIAEARAEVEHDEKEEAGRKRVEADDREDDDREDDRRERRTPRRARPVDDERDEPRRRESRRDDRREERRDDRPSRRDDYRPEPARQKRGVSRGIAALLSFLFVGAGQIAQGRVLTGLTWFFGVLFLYACSPCSFFTTTIVGIILHVICILDAAAHE